MEKKKISIVIPIYNEEKNISLIYKEIKKIFMNINYQYEIIFVNDGSTDDSYIHLEKLALKDKFIIIIDFSRNFGKEIATTAGINKTDGEACIMIDADLQHPPKLIPKFIKRWEEGFDVVIGVAKSNKKSSISTKVTSYLYYKLINKIVPIKIKPHSTDFRLIDRNVIEEFNKLQEKNRMTRGLIDWLGFKRAYISFEVPERKNGVASYTFIKRIKLAFNSVISLTIFPLRLVGYLGIFITLISLFSSIFVIIEKYILNDPLNLHISGIAVLAIIIIFFIGIVLISLGFITLYIANIHEESIHRPLYIIKRHRKIKES